ncbi:MAG: phosphatidylserine decarboxylase [Legionella sp.]|nr:MAG: phosphatidylserine decarboxylase [Legionella sp.]PJD97108.1 MAG: phosphatidylserine decarboxylase [Legionella sp.]
MLKDWLKTAPQWVLPKKSISVLAGLLANVRHSTFKNALIRYFIKTYQVNMNEALIEQVEQYPTFNEFFIRHLKPECRPLATADILSPVDGVISELGAIEAGQLIQAKGRHYSVQELLACEDSRAQAFLQGQFATVYLSPKDYHRIHMPLKARLCSMHYVPGALFSVQPSTARVIPKLFARNERLVVFFETEIGAMAMVLVGATIVGAIATAWHGDIKRTKDQQHFDYTKNALSSILEQGEEMGHFKLGSTVILLFAEGARMTWQHAMKAGSAVRFGEPLGHFKIE